MSRARRRPPHPWQDLPCAADDLFELVGALLRGETAASVAVGRASPAALDVLVDRHRLGPFLATHAVAILEDMALPAATLARVRAARERQVGIAERCLTLLRDVDAHCQAEGLRFLVVKGPALATRCYGDVAARGYWDLDLMVAAPDRPAMESILQRIGAVRLSRVFVAMPLSAAFHHAFDYERGGVKLDLHWCMTRLPGVRSDLAAAFARADALELGGRTARVLSLEDELHFMLVGAFADLQRGHVRLQTLVDLFELSRQQPTMDWSAFFARRAHEGTERICRATLEVLLAALRLGAEAPALVDALRGRSTTRAARELFLPSPGGLRGKRWAARALPVGLLHYAAWWSVSLPFRVAASHPAWRRDPGRPVASSGR